jgi:hypothetical protein
MLKSLAPFGLDKKVFIVCMDTKAAKTLQRCGYSAFCIEDNTLGSFCPWNTKGYDKICYFKLVLIYRILSLHKHALLVDGDIVFQKDPMEDMREWWKNTIYDVWIQNDAQENRFTANMCTGYMFIKTSDRLIELYDCVSEKGQKKYEKCAFDNNDQTYFNQFIKPACMMCPLPLEKYPNGKMYYEHDIKIEFGEFNLCDDCRNNPNIEFILPIHPNPNVIKHKDLLKNVKEVLGILFIV